MWKLILATVALGDYCFQHNNGVNVRVHLRGTQIDVNASAYSQWVGIGVPKEVGFDEMSGGNFVIGGGGQVRDRKLSLPYNSAPSEIGTQLVGGSSSVASVGAMTSMNFSRLLAPAGSIVIDATKPFRLLWAFGTLRNGEPEYHNRNRGSFMVDLVQGNCPAIVAPTPVATQPPTPVATQPPSRKAGGKKARRCPKGQVKCSAKLQAAGSNCHIGVCTAKPTSGCAADQTLCTAAMQAQGSNCVVGKCVAISSVCAADQTLCTAAMQAQGRNCVVGNCVATCTADQTLCTAAMQAQGRNCIVGKCVAPCTANQILCTAAMQAQGRNCIVGKCVAP